MLLLCWAEMAEGKHQPHPLSCSVSGGKLRLSSSHVAHPRNNVMLKIGPPLLSEDPTNALFHKLLWMGKSKRFPSASQEAQGCGRS